MLPYISNFLKNLFWLLSFWIEYGNNYQLFFFPKCTFNVYLCNLRRHHNRFQTLRRCHGGIFNFPTLNIWEIDLLGTSYIHVDFLTCRICRTADLEVLIPTFCNTVTNYILNWLNLKIRELWNSFVTTTSQFSLNVLKLRVPVNVTILCRISDCVLMVHLCKMMISLGGFSHFSKFWFFGLLVG